MSDRYNPRVICETERVSSARPNRSPRGSTPAGLPDPPDNPEFEAMPEAVQARFVRRFEVGIALTEARDFVAARATQGAWYGWVRRCHQNRLREREATRRDRAQRDAILEQNRRKVR